jgi:DNA-binding CsgD family transcriptional regulator
MRLRAAVSFHADPVLTGCGFALAFGWLWFAGFGELWREGVAGYLAIRANERLLALALGAGFVAFGCAAGLARRERPYLAAALAHGGALLCLGFLYAVDQPSIGIALVGLAGVCLGTYWMFRILALKPAQAVVALAWASCAAIFLAWMVSITPSEAGIAIGAAGCFLAAWLFALALVTRTVKYGHAIKPEPAGQSWEKRAVALCVAMWLAFFALGAMHAMPMPHAEPLAVLAAHLAGAALAVPVLYQIFRSASTGDGVGQTIVTALCALFLTALCQLLLPSFAPFALDMGSAFLEATCLAGFTGLIQHAGLASNPGSIPRLAGLFLAALLLAVKMGHWAGYGVMHAHGTTGTTLFIAMLIVMSAFVNMAVFRMTAPQRNTEHAARHESIVQDVTAGSIKLQKEIMELLNAREQTVAALLVQGYTNNTIAACLSVTKNAVRWHIKNLNRKTGATSRQQLLDILTEGNPPV